MIIDVKDVPRSLLNQEVARNYNYQWWRQKGVRITTLFLMILEFMAFLMILALFYLVAFL